MTETPIWRLILRQRAFSDTIFFVSERYNNIPSTFTQKVTFDRNSLCRMKYDYQCFLSSLRQVPMPPSPFHLSVFQFQSARTTYVSYKNNIHNNNDKSDNTALGMAKHKQAYCRISLTLLSWYNFYCNAWNKRFEMEINAPKHRFESLNLYAHTYTTH